MICPIHEANDCHVPAGSPQGGQFCSRGTLTRGLVATVTIRLPLAQRLVSGKASVDDVLRLIDTKDAGAYWWDDQGQEYAYDPYEWAQVETSDALTTELAGLRDKPWRKQDRVIASVGVVLTGTKPKGADPDDWGSALRGRFKINLRQVQYNAGNGWKKLNVRGRSVKVRG